jgi:hypothetical protein
LVAAVLTFTSLPFGTANAQLACDIRLDIVKGGFIIGLGGGNGTLRCGNETYALQVGGIGAGLLIGVSKMTLSGPVRRLRQVQDIAGTYAGAGAGIVVAGGVKGVLLSNQNGVELVLGGTQIGLSASAAFNGMTIRFQR